MNIIIRGQKIKISSELKSYITEKIKKFEPQLMEPAKCDVVLQDENGVKGGIDKAVKVTLSLPGLKNPIFICERSGDFMSSIDLAQESLEPQILKYKEQIKIGERYPAKYRLEEELNKEEE